MTSWKSFVTSVVNCAECKSYPMVRAVSNPRAWNGCDLPDPKNVLDFARSRVLFISEAPPGGNNRTFFYLDAKEDTLREHLFEALRMSAFKVSSLQDFYKLNCYLLPSFCYPCGQSSSPRSANSHPNRKMVEHSATTHLGLAIDYIQPSRIVLLGERAAWAARAIPRPCFVTYWPTKRLRNYEQQWRKFIAPTLRNALT